MHKISGRKHSGRKTIRVPPIEDAVAAEQNHTIKKEKKADET